MSGDLDTISEDNASNVGDEEESDADPQKLILSRSDVLAALQAQTLAALPAPVKKKLKALKKIQLETTRIEAKFYEEIHDLECKYHNLYTPQYEKRAQIIAGQYEPTEEECDWDSDKEEEELANELDKKVKLSEEAKTESAADKDVKGIPEFWLTIFKNVSLLQEMVEEPDLPILRHLDDIKVRFTSEPMGFVLEFQFSENEYFTNKVLTKEYEMKCIPDDTDPFSFEGPEIIKCKGCVIDWVKGKNVTVKTMKKKQKHKGRGEVRTVTKTVRRSSFFNFFAPPVISEDPDAEVDEETQTLLTADFEIGHYIRERIVPRAVLYFTGEALEDEEDDFEEEEGEEESGEEEEDDADYVPGSKAAKRKQAPPPQECKNQ